MKTSNTRPRLPFCWECSRKFWGNKHVVIEILGINRELHLSCAEEVTRKAKK